VAWVKLVSDVGAYTTMRMGNLFESSEYFGRSLSWFAAVKVPFSLSWVQVARPFHCASLPAGMVITLCIWMFLFSALAPGDSSSFSWASRRRTVDVP